MQSLLDSLNQVSGVMGSMLCSPDGKVLAHAFPPVFDDATLQATAEVLADGAAGLETVTGAVQLLDLRFSEARVLVKPTARGLLLLLCSAGVNVQPVIISASVAAKKLERLASVTAEEPAADPTPAASAPAPSAGPAPAEPPKRKAKWWPSV